MKLFRLMLLLLALTALSSRAKSAEPVTRLSMLKALDLMGNVCRPGESEECRGVAFVFLSPEGGGEAIGKLNELQRDLAAVSVELYGVVAERAVSRAAAVQFAQRARPGFPVLFDASLTIARALQPTHLPMAILLNPAGQVCYRGGIDPNLRLAAVAMSSGKLPVPGDSPLVGSKYNAGSLEEALNAVTYNRDIAPILFANCAECHREGEVAPFELTTFEQAAKRAGFLAEMTGSGRMPPWKADPSVGHFLGERLLHPEEIRLLKAWSERGAPQGAAEDLPPAPSFKAGWQLGEPDLVLKMVEPFTVSADGPDQNRFFVIPIDIPEDKVVVGVEFRPGNPRVVHHAILYLDRSGNARKRDAATPEPGYPGFVATGLRGGALGFWAPGYTPRFYPSGVGQNLSPKTDLALQLHYHPSGKEEVDRSMVGVHFADKPLPARIGGLALINFDVDIPAGAAKHRMTHSFTTPVDLRVVDIVPHMHMIGTDMEVRATTPDGKTIGLIRSKWDFNWQDVYRLREVTHLPKGTRIDLEAVFDNSADNPYNPSTPPKRIVFGEETTDEMCICAFRIIEDADAKSTRDTLQAAVRESLMLQMRNPKVLSNVTRFMMSGNGQQPARAEN